MHTFRIILLFLIGTLTTGCGEENAAKVAPWLGMETLTESKADALGSLSLKKAKACRKKHDGASDFSKCIEEALKHGEAAEELYARDCNFGNKRACRKLQELRDAWQAFAEK
jgi:hypothetical protein